MKNRKLYDRTSREVEFCQIPLAFQKEIVSHVESSLLPEVRDDVVFCETRSRRLYGNGILSKITRNAGRDSEEISFAGLLPGYLVVLANGEYRGTVVMSASVATMRVESNPRLPSDGALIDSGISVWAHWSRFPEGGSWHIPVGDDPAGNSFRGDLINSIRRAKGG
ncbi:hypothetical protein ACWCQK_40990 [Streptomyces sp. NPDC002306]